MTSFVIYDVFILSTQTLSLLPLRGPEVAAVFIYWYLCTELLSLLGGALRVYLINYIDMISSPGLEFVTALKSEGGNPAWTAFLVGNVLEIASASVTISLH